MAGCGDCGAANSEELNDPLFRRVLWIALIANFAMFFVEVAASHLSDSLALQADALDFFGDGANYAISLFVVGMALSVRARASLFKGATMAAFGLFIVGSALYRTFTGSEPEPLTMGAVAVLALAVNVGVALLLFKYRNGDSNRQSIWLCSRNDAIGNLAVIVAALGVSASASRWPDLAVAAIIASLNFSSAIRVVKLAKDELQKPQHQRELVPGSPVEPRLN